MDKIFFIDNENVIRILATVPIMYISVILYIRILGKRSTSQLNSFDWIVTVAMGSLVASTIVLKNVSLIDGLSAILSLLMLQFLLTKVTAHLPQFKNIISSSPKLLFIDGEFINDNMKNERIAKSEILAAIRQSGVQHINDVYAVVLETNADFSVIEKCDDNPPQILTGVEGLPPSIKNAIEEKNNL